MTLLGTFLSHEALTQLRSTRFRAIGAVYVLASSAPAVFAFVVAGRASYAVGSATYAALLDFAQPLLTLLLAGLISVDAITREREEGSFAVVSLAPLSATGYLLRRWLAVIVMLLPLTIAPRLIGAALAAVQLRQLPLLAAFAGGWALHVLPVVVIVSALALALGTINGSTILAIVVAFLLMTAGLDEVNDIAAHWHRHFDGPAGMVVPDGRVLTQLQWSIRGWYEPRLPTEAAYPLGEVWRVVSPQGALLFGFGALFLGIATVYLRRTRRNLRVWSKPRPDHPLRSFLRLVNRLRDEYSPDGSIGAAEWIAIASGVVLFGASIGFLETRTRLFERLGAERYAAYTEVQPLPMTPEIVPLGAHVRGSLARDGHVRAHTELTLRNEGARPVAHLGFTLNPLVTVVGVRASSGRASLVRRWQRVGLDVDPPLGAGQSRTFTFDIDGTPGDIDVAIVWAGGYATKWRRYLHAVKSFDLSDLSRSTVTHHVDETRISLAASDLMPVPRYTPWTIDRDTDAFEPESIEPAAPVDLVLAQPFAAAADSCGHLATGGAPLESRCTIALASYSIAGGPLATSTIAPGITLAYIPAHAALARVHGPSLAGAVTRAEQAWSGLSLPRPIVYVENATSMSERDRGDWEWEWRTLRSIHGSGVLQLVPENLFSRYAAMNEDVAASALIVNSLRTRRSVVPEEAAFFRSFYATTVTRRVSASVGSRAVVSATGLTLPRNALLGSGGSSRLRFVTAALEARAGASHVVEGINDFAAAGPRPGTARELVAAIGRRAGLDLSRMHDDYFAAGNAPRLTFEGVTFRRSGGSWEVRGTLHNDGTGEAFCAIALRTAGSSLWQTLRAGGGERVPFVFTTPSEPHTLQLDPDRVCYRESFIGAIESVDYRGAS